MADDRKKGPVKVDEELILELNFVPSWARKPPGKNHFDAPAYEEGERRKGRQGRDRRPRRRDGGEGPQRRRPPRDDYGRRRMRPSRERPRRESGQPEHSRYARPERDVEHGPRPERHRDDRPHGRPRSDMPPVAVSVLPKPKGLSVIVHKIHGTKRSYPLSEVAGLFLSNPEFCDVKVESRRGENRLRLYQCKLCRMVALERDILMGHMVKEHFAGHFDREEREGEAPAGSFVCVARCGLSGVLLGPPNHHSYAERVRETHQTRYGHMSEEAYRQKIETVRDPELIEQWRQESCREVVYRLKGKEDSPESNMSWGEAEAHFLSEVVPKQVVEGYRAVLPATVARKMEDNRLREAIREVWIREARHPRSLLFALRAALRHMHLHLFRAGGDEIFACAVGPSPLDPSHTIESIGEVLTFLHENPGCTRKEMIERLRPDSEPDSPQVAELLKPLGWLVEKGHIIEFFNGTLSVPLGQGA